MKLAYIEYKDIPKKSSIDKKDTLNLILESTNDVIKYFEWTATSNGKKLIDCWDNIVENVNRGFESNSHLPYDPIYILAGLLARKNMATRKYSLIDLAKDYDNININKMKTMLKWITDGIDVRVSHLGGISPMTIFRIEKEIASTEEKIKQYLISGTINDDGFPDVNTKYSTLIIENDESISKRLKGYLKSIGLLKESPYKKNYSILNQFKTKTIFLSDEKKFEFIESIILKGINHIIIETTLIDKKQFIGFKKIIEKVMVKHEDRVLDVTLILNNLESNTDMLDTAIENININIIS